MRRLFLCAASLALLSSYAAAVKVEVLQTKLDHPWSLAFLPDNRGMLITLKGGQLRLWQPDKGLSDPLTGVPKVWANGQGGLLDVALAPDFAQSRRVWLSFAEADSEGKAGTAVGYGRLSDDLRPFFANSQSFPPETILVDVWYLMVTVICLLAWGRIINALPPRTWINCRVN